MSAAIRRLATKRVTSSHRCVSPSRVNQIDVPVGGFLAVCRSDDYGSKWTKLADVPDIAPLDVLAGDRQNYGHVYIGYIGRGVLEFR